MAKGKRVGKQRPSAKATKRIGAYTVQLAWSNAQNACR